MLVETHNFFLSENDKSFVITKPKVASRFIQEIYHPNTYEICINNSLQIINGGSVSTAGIESYNNLFNKNTNIKDIFLIYRHPLKRYISGVVEDLINSMNHFNYNEQFYLRYYLKKYNIESYDLFENLKMNHYKRDFLLDVKYIEFINEILSDFFFWQVQTTPINSHHSSPYMVVYNKILKSENIDNRKIYLVNLDDTRNKLSEILLPYFDNSRKLEVATRTSSHQSNKNFYNLIYEIIQKNDFFKELVDSVCDLDFYFYDEFEKSSLNILNFEIRN